MEVDQEPNISSQCLLHRLKQSTFTYLNELYNFFCPSLRALWRGDIAFELIRTSGSHTSIAGVESVKCPHAVLIPSSHSSLPICIQKLQYSERRYIHTLQEKDRTAGGTCLLGGVESTCTTGQCRTETRWTQYTVIFGIFNGVILVSENQEEVREDSSSNNQS